MLQLPASASLIPADYAQPSHPSDGLGGFFKDILATTARDFAVYGQQALYRKVGVVPADDPAPDPAPAPAPEPAKPAFDVRTAAIVGGGAAFLLIVVLALR